MIKVDWFYFNIKMILLVVECAKLLGLCIWQERFWLFVWCYFEFI